jgi:glycosyltransferase involved in cell wall biosynthesis
MIRSVGAVRDMNKNKRVQILLSTYNGGRFLREQLDSYLKLDNYEEVKVLIRDDGSTDGTLQILEEYGERHGFEILAGQNIGLNASMLELFRRSDPACDFFATSDQDDIWLPGKISAGVKALTQIQADKPLLYGSCTQVVSEDLSPAGRICAPPRGASFYNALIQNVVPGHTQILNRPLVESLLAGSAAEKLVVDWWIYLLASATGDVILDTHAHVLYRQHGGNAIGSETTAWKLWRNRWKRLTENNFAMAAKQANLLLDNYENKLNRAEYCGELQKFLNQDTFFARLRYAFSSKACRQSAVETLCFRLLFLFGAYRNPLKAG